ncbi:hypothetical protein MUK42_32903 [Musa troglodytarum]|uniref:Uncharacterized protein n=1 Tax=Musa troglodytarum TaxID=320322 RepID=A0A9E7L051_9LILI|nr:hypothetical protein MUK42_32903 [Musa troglodytarum]
MSTHLLCVAKLVIAPHEKADLWPLVATFVHLSKLHCKSIHPTKLEALANGFHRLTFLNEAIDCNIDLRTYDSTPMSIQDLPHQNPSNPVTLTIPHEEYILQKHPRILRKAYNPGRIHGVRNLPPVSPTCHWPSTPSTCTPVVSVASAVTIRL